MINPYKALVSYDGQQRFEDHLVTMRLFDIFKPIYEAYDEDKEVCKKIVMYIAYAFSLESEFLTTYGGNWDEVSKTIFDHVELEKLYYEDVSLLQSDYVRAAAENWLKFQNEDNWTQYVHYRDLRRQMLIYSLQDLKKSSGEIDIEAKYKAAVYSKDLLVLMQQSFDQFIQNNVKLKTNVDAINRVNREKVTRTPADYALK